MLHLANTNFEWELTEGAPSVEKGLSAHRNFLQLQFLPFLYGNPEDGVVVTHKPPDSYWEDLERVGFSLSKLPKLHLLSEKSLPYSTLDTWGASLSVASWAKERGIAYAMPKIDVVKQVTSKEFSYLNNPQLPDSALLRTEKQLKEWLKIGSFPKVIKTCFGFAGRGHLFLETEGSVDAHRKILHHEWSCGHPVIGEPWVKRVFDFSTQWIISEGEVELGATICENDHYGRHIGNVAGKDSSIFGPFEPYLKKHLLTAKPLLKTIADLGYFGNLGLDAMVYQLPSEHKEIHLHPVVEINPRKTFGFLALAILKLHYKSPNLTLTFSKESHGGVLPKELSLENRRMTFPKQLRLDPHILAL